MFDLGRLRPTLVLLAIATIAACSDEAPSDSGDDCTSCDDDRGRRDTGGSDADDDTGTGGEDGTSGGDSVSGTDVPNGSDTITTQCGTGRVEGRVCAPNEATWLGGATVTVSGADCDDQTFSLEVVSDEDGFYTFPQVPAGYHALTVSMGSFSAEYAVQVNPDETTDLVAASEKTCLGADEVEIAVIQGFYDSIEVILDNLGVEYTYYRDDDGELSSAEQFLRDPEALAEYDIVLINCGEQWFYYGFSESDPDAVHAEIGANLRDYVNDGGSVYVSDMAYFLIEYAFPDAIQFSDDEGDYMTALRGAMGTVTANVTDSSLAGALGQSSVSISFPLQGWVVPNSVGSDVFIAMQADVRLTDDSQVSDAPLLVGYRPSPTAGLVYFTSFHNESQLEDEIGRILHYVIFSL